MALRDPGIQRRGGSTHVRAWILVAILILSALQSAAADTITYTAQSRRVAAIAGPIGGSGNSDTKDASGFAPWSEMASASYSDTNGSAGATATQVSILDVDTGITLNGNLSAVANVGFTGNAQSLFNLSFNLAAYTPYVSTLSGSANLTSFLLGLSGGAITFEANSSGVLPAGDYSLGVNHRAAASDGSSNGSYSYSLAVTAPSGIPGDYNNDRSVDAADYIVWRKFDGTNTRLANDTTPGMVSSVDYDVWRANFGTAAGGGAGASANAAVPEASTLVLLLVGMLATYCCRHVAVS